MPGRNYPSGWRRVRLHVLERDDYQCKVRSPVCTFRATEVDHIVEVAKGGAVLDPMNCRASCRECNQWRNKPPTSAVPSRDW